MRGRNPGASGNSSLPHHQQAAGKKQRQQNGPAAPAGRAPSKRLKRGPKATPISPEQPKTDFPGVDHALPAIPPSFAEMRSRAQEQLSAALGKAVDELQDAGDFQELYGVSDVAQAIELQMFKSFGRHLTDSVRIRGGRH